MNTAEHYHQSPHKELKVRDLGEELLDPLEQDYGT